MKIDYKKLAVSLIIPLLVGAVSGLANRDSMAQFDQLIQPALAPPGWVFPVVWTILYLLMGIASYLVWVTPGQERQKQQALRVYGLQLAVNFLWSFLFFGLEWYLAAFLWLVLLWYLIRLTMKQFGEVSAAAAKLLLPYLIWVTFAGYLNLGIWWLNR